MDAGTTNFLFNLPRPCDLPLWRPMAGLFVFLAAYINPLANMHRARHEFVRPRRLALSSHYTTHKS
jgi:hypothetical protein